jgi:membrane-bound lytic murein transglycosylase B
MNNLRLTIYDLLFTILFSSVLISPSFILAQDLSVICQLDNIEKECVNLEPVECRKLLESCEAYYQEQSNEIEKDINKTEEEKKTLENKISSLKKKIQNLDYQIRQSNLIIKDLGLQIEDTEDSIGNTFLKIEDSKRKLANILRNIYEEDQKPFIEILVSGNSISNFFDNLASLERLNFKSKELLQNVKLLKINLESQKESLDQEKQDLENIVEIQTVQKQQNFQSKNEQEYQKYLAEKQEVDQKAAEIRARIFELIGVPKAPTFGEAYEIAEYVENITGVRPAFLLAVLTQESNIGKNVGQCYLKNTETGAGETIKTSTALSRVMKPVRDIQPFLTITKELGRDPFFTPVSCPMSYGWGGAMGPAQFIPSTWMIYRDQLKDIMGEPADPWSIKDSFLAAALYLADYGAAEQTPEGEFNAALSYFAGPSWYNSKYSSVYKRDYGYPVMAITKAYESDIAKIK